ncbi:macrocin-O-methyltransferase domain-containing protein [Trypanosoma grayi]|uniref:macrocin-O-methyltransferase domain-containing protein n=1 Tax=Trypanosoma grayi TaxID=71804 RepID=UPI0004F48FB8|nr:macrocin-O-methyltransferase domain-containing protein [Trypanosoma grayi]KEG10968.1 macrocin-O-methyltransferase domain-containing protein [Trypanosoma grayi]
MLSRSLRRHGTAEVVAAIKAGRHTEALLQLNAKKRARQHEENVDYGRALCFLAGAGDALHARQALLEELRHFPDNGPARMLLYEVNGKVRPLLLPPEEVMKDEPLFGLLCDALLDHTMLSWTRLYSLYNLAREICSSKCSQGGVLMECGVAGGGSAVLLAVVAAHCSDFPRRVYALDTFDGMPDPTTSDVLDNSGIPAESTSWGSGTCSALQDNVRRLAKNFDVDERLVIVPGMFQRTLPDVLKDIGEEGIAMLHVDADWYESTKSVLDLAWPGVRRGGVVQVDDYYYWSGCRKAVDEFMLDQTKLLTAALQQSMKLQAVDGNAVYFTRP